MASRNGDLGLTATERTAITALMQIQQQLSQQMAELEREKAAVAKDIEKRLRLPAGALGDDATHQVNMDDWKVEPLNE